MYMSNKVHIKYFRSMINVYFPQMELLYAKISTVDYRYNVVNFYLYVILYTTGDP